MVSTSGSRTVGDLLLAAGTTVCGRPALLATARGRDRSPSCSGGTGRNRRRTSTCSTAPVVRDTLDSLRVGREAGPGQRRDRRSPGPACCERRDVALRRRRAGVRRRGKELSYPRRTMDAVTDAERFLPRPGPGSPAPSRRRPRPSAGPGTRSPRRHTLVVAPTGSGKTLAAFLWSLDRLAATPPPDDPKRRCRVLYVSPLKALAVDVERNLRAPLAGIRQAAPRLGSRCRHPGRHAIGRHRR